MQSVELHHIVITSVVISDVIKKLYGLFLWMGFSCLKATEPLRGGSLLFSTKFLESPGTHLIDLGMMKGWVDLGATQWIGNQTGQWTGPLDWESSSLTTRPSPHKYPFMCKLTCIWSKNIIIRLLNKLYNIFQRCSARITYIQQFY